MTKQIDNLLRTGKKENVELVVQLLKGQGFNTTPFLEELKSLAIALGRSVKTIEDAVDFSLLKWLDLEHNQLTSLPEGIGNLTNLKWLDLRHNQLTSLCESIGNLTNLEKLTLSYNHIEEREITRLKKQLPNCTIIF